jgi:hypothetical protein
MKNKISGLLMEVGAVYDKRKLHGKRYFGQLLERSATLVKRSASAVYAVPSMNRQEKNTVGRYPRSATSIYKAC